MDQWHDTEAALTQLARHAEGKAIEAGQAAGASGPAGCACS
jgi:hypothetical protein